MILFTLVNPTEACVLFSVCITPDKKKNPHMSFNVLFFLFVDSIYIF